MADLELPPLYHAADLSSIEAQRSFLMASRCRLFGLLGAAFFGLFTWRGGASPVDWAGVLAAVCFFTAVIVETYLYKATPERTWYEGRAAAESVKTLSWRFAVGGEPFNIGTTSEASVADLFLKQLNGLFDVVKNLDLVLPTSSGEQISERMRRVRGASLVDRKTVYERERVQAQQDWYQKKAGWNKARAKAWTKALVLIEIAGIVFAVLKAVGSIQGDLLGFTGVIVAAITAWLQTKQHSALATAYAVTALELASIRSQISRHDEEADWAKFVSDAEEAFSREHTLWKASRGIRSI